MVSLSVCLPSGSGWDLVRLRARCRSAHTGRPSRSQSRFGPSWRRSGSAMRRQRRPVRFGLLAPYRWRPLPKRTSSWQPTQVRSSTLNRPDKTANNYLVEQSDGRQTGKWRSLSLPSPLDGRHFRRELRPLNSRSVLLFRRYRQFIAQLLRCPNTNS